MMADMDGTRVLDVRKSPNFSEAEMKVILQGIQEHKDVIANSDRNYSARKTTIFKQITDRVNKISKVESTGSLPVERYWKQIRKKWFGLRFSAMKLHRAKLEGKGVSDEYEDKPYTQQVLDIILEVNKTNLPEVVDFSDSTVGEDHFADMTGSNITRDKERPGTVSHNQALWKDNHGRFPSLSSCSVKQELLSEDVIPCFTDATGSRFKKAQVLNYDDDSYETRMTKGMSSNHGPLSQTNRPGYLKENDIDTHIAQEEDGDCPVQFYQLSDAEIVCLLAEIPVHLEAQSITDLETGGLKPSQWQTITDKINTCSEAGAARSWQEVCNTFETLKNAALARHGKEAQDNDSGCEAPYSRFHHLVLDVLKNNFITEESTKPQTTQQQSPEDLTEEQRDCLIAEIDKFKETLLPATARDGDDFVRQQNVAWRLVAEKVNTCDVGQIRWSAKQLQHKWTELQQEAERLHSDISSENEDSVVHRILKLTNSRSVSLLPKTRFSSDFRGMTEPQNVRAAKNSGTSQPQRENHYKLRENIAPSWKSKIACDLPDEDNDMSLRKRGKVFTSKELDIMLTVYEANREIINTKKMDSESVVKKQQVVQCMVKQMNAQGAADPPRTMHRVLSKLQNLRREALLWRRHCRNSCGLVEAGEERHSLEEPLWDRLLRLVEMDNDDGDDDDDDGDGGGGDDGGDDDVGMENLDQDDEDSAGADREENSEKRKEASALIQKHLNSLVDICGRLRQLGVEAGALVIDRDAVLCCGSERVKRVATHPLLPQLLSGLTTTPGARDPQCADQWTVRSLNTPDPDPDPDPSTLSPSHNPPTSLPQSHNLPSSTLHQSHDPPTSLLQSHNPPSSTLPQSHDPTPSPLPRSRNPPTSTTLPPSHNPPTPSPLPRSRNPPHTHRHWRQKSGEDVKTLKASSSALDTAADPAACSEAEGGGEEEGVEGEPLIMTTSVSEDPHIHDSPMEGEGDLNEESRHGDDAMDDDNDNDDDGGGDDDGDDDSDDDFAGSDGGSLESSGDRSLGKIGRMSSTDPKKNPVKTPVKTPAKTPGSKTQHSDNTSPAISPRHHPHTPPAHTTPTTATSSTSTSTSTTSSSPLYGFTCQKCSAEFSLLSSFVQHHQSCGRQKGRERSDKFEGVELAIKTEDCPEGGVRVPEGRWRGAEGRWRGTEGVVMKNPLVVLQKLPADVINVILSRDQSPLQKKGKTADRRFACQFCGRKFPFPAHCRDHERTHTGEKPFRCDQCFKCFSRKHHLKLHMERFKDKVHVPITTQALAAKRLKTEESTVTTATESNNAAERTTEPAGDSDGESPRQPGSEPRHELTSASAPEAGTGPSSQGQTGPPLQSSGGENRRFACQFCGRRFQFAAHCKEHERIHTGEKPFNCDRCGRCFSRKYSLTVHKCGSRRHAPPTTDTAAKEPAGQNGGSSDSRTSGRASRFQCQFCGRPFSKRNDCKRHERIHTGERPHRCKHCGREFTLKKTLKVHQRQHKHGTPVPLTCQVCESPFLHLQELNEHRRRVHGLEPEPEPESEAGQNMNAEPSSEGHLSASYDDIDDDDDETSPQPPQGDPVKPEKTPPSKHKSGATIPRPRRHACRFCGKKFYRFPDWENHERLHTGEKRHQCGQCGKAFVGPVGLKVHTTRHHGKGSHACDQCGHCFSHKYALRAHLKIRHGMVEDSRLAQKRALTEEEAATLRVQMERRTCKECGKVLPHPGNMRWHMRTHQRQKPLVCGACGKRLPDLQRLRSHMDRHQGLRKFQCEVCGAKFTLKGSLTVHMRYHAGKPFRCELCGESFSTNSHLTVHRRTHTGERPFLCDICGASFAQGGRLTVHRRRHTGEKPYRCEDCGERFQTTHRLSIHRRKHTGIEPHTCHVCGKSFQTANHRNTHLRLHTGERPYVCGVCGEKFHRADVLRQHQKRHDPVSLSAHPTPRFKPAPRPPAGPGDSRKIVAATPRMLRMAAKHPPRGEGGGSLEEEGGREEDLVKVEPDRGVGVVGGMMQEGLQEGMQEGLAVQVFPESSVLASQMAVTQNAVLMDLSALGGQGF